MENRGGGIQELNVREVKAMLDAGGEGARFLDVREPFEIQIASIPGVEHLTEDLAREIVDEGGHDERLVFICHHGVRSLSAAGWFAMQGFKNVASMQGGIHAWSAEIDPSIPTY